MELEAMKQTVKELIISECDREDELEWHEIKDDELLFGSKSDIGLDSLDALQLSLAIKQKFGVTIDGSRASKKHLQSVNSIVSLITSEQEK